MKSILSIELAEVAGQAFADAKSNDVLFYPSNSNSALLFGAKQNDVPSLAITESNIQISSHLVPNTNEIIDIGTSNMRFRDLYLSGNTIDLGGLKIGTMGNEIVVDGVNISKLDKVTKASHYASSTAVATWVSRQAPLDDKWKSICWSAEQTIFVAVSENGRVMASPNGVTWSWRDSLSFVSASWKAVTWSSALGLFVAVGQGNYVIVSSDSITWVSHTCPNGDWRAICWSHELSLFVVAGYGKMMVSSNGINWTSQAVYNGTWTSICWSPELQLFVGVGSALDGTSSVITSSDGVTWTTRTTPESIHLTSICWSSELSLFVSPKVYVQTEGVGYVLCSSDGFTWTSRALPSGGYISTDPQQAQEQYVSWSPELSLFVIICSISGLIFSSSDGVTWIAANNLPQMRQYNICWSRELSMFAVTSSHASGPTPIYTTLPTIPAAKSTLLARSAFISVDNSTGKLTVNGNINFSGNLTQNGAPFQSGTPGFSNNASSVYVKDGSNFGVGTSTPATKLDVNGAIATNGIVRLGIDGALSNVTMAASAITSGILPVARGGTGVTSVTGSNNLVLSDSPAFTGTLTAETISATNLQQGGLNVALSNHIHDASAITSGVLPVARGGTGTSTSVGSGSVVFNSNAALSNTTLINTTNVTGNILPSASLMYDLGTSNMRFRDLYLSGNTIDLGGVRIGTTANSNVTIAGVNVNAFNKTYKVATTRAISLASTWITRTVAEANDWRSVVWSPELSIYVAVASTGTNRVMTSPNGIVWTTRSAPSQPWMAVCWSKERSKFVAVGVCAYVMTSPDGIIWTTKSVTDGFWLSVCWSPERQLFVAVSQETSVNRVMTSTDGDTWTTVNGTSGLELQRVCWSPERGLFVATINNGMTILTSQDGLTWTQVSSPAQGNLIGCCWSAELSMFVAVGFGALVTSSDGITWTSRTISASGQRYDSIVWSPELSLFVALTATTILGNNILMSVDGITWTTTQTPASNQWASLCWSPEHSQFVAVSYSSSGAMTTSPALPASKSSLIINPAWMTINNSNGFLGLNNSTPTERLDINGNIRNTGNITATGDITAFSDARLKTDLQPITNAMDKVCAINGYTYRKIGQDSSERRHAGVIAQEVAKVLPEAVTQQSNDFMSVAYGNMVALLIEAVKELKQEQATNQAKLDELKSMVL